MVGISFLPVSRVVFGVTENGAISSMRKIGSGSLDPTSVSEMVQVIECISTQNSSIQLLYCVQK